MNDALFASHGFTTQYNKSIWLPECGLAQAIALQHRSGAKLYMVACNSQESAFSYCFATPPKDDKGLAHIVEHAVFCGSKNYPLKEPFANLQKTSVCSFLNAMTYPDQTLYPAASSFTSDFLQLLRVYGDAVFFPLLENQAIAQEGIRYTPDSMDGIVYNEMQAYYGDFEAYVADCSLRSLFPAQHPNSFDAGGNPQAIASINCRNYQEVRDFHRQHYRAENCRIILYGFIPQQQLPEILHYLDQLFSEANKTLLLEHQSNNENKGDKIDQILNNALPLPCRQELYQPIAVAQPNPKQRSIMFSWLLPAQQNAQSSLEYRLIAELLLGHSGSILELPIMQSGWGADLSLGSGLELEFQTPVLRVGLSAYQVKEGPKDEQCFRKLIFSALEKFCTQAEQEPNNPELDLLWQGSLNSLEYEEYSLGEHGGDDGIYALERCLQLAKASHFYPETVEIFGMLQPFASIAALRAQGPQGLAAFATKIRHYTLDNPHWTLQLFEEVATKETPPPNDQNQKAFGAKLPYDSEFIQQSQKDFAQYQLRQDHLEQTAKIVAMNRDQFNSLPPKPQYNYFCEHGIEFFCHSKKSQNNLEKGLVQLDLYWDISTWNQEQTVLLPLFLDLVEDMGLPGISYAEVARQKSLHIGHWEAEFSFKRSFYQMDKLQSFIHIRLSFLPTEWQSGLALFWQLFANCNWQEHSRLKELLQSLCYEKHQELCTNPLSYAIRRSHYRLSQMPATMLSQSSCLQAQQNEWLYGLGQLQLLATICQQNNMNTQLAESFGSLRWAIMQAPLACAISANEQQLLQLRWAIAGHQRLWQSKLQPIFNRNDAWAPSWASIVNHSWPHITCEKNIELWQGNITLEYLSIAMPIPHWNYSNCQTSIIHPAMELLIKLLQNGPAWRRIRLQQGAYGVRVQQQDGFFLLCSSQDPNAFHSLQLFCQAVEDIRDKAQNSVLNADLNSEFYQEFEAALVQTLAEKLKASPPSEDARIALHLAKTGLNDDGLQAWLEQLRKMQMTDLLWAAESILQSWSSQKSHVSCIFAAQSCIQKPKQECIPTEKRSQLECYELPHYAWFVNLMNDF